jgi:hypothetical protein
MLLDYLVPRNVPRQRASCEGVAFRNTSLNALFLSQSSEDLRATEMRCRRCGGLGSVSKRRASPYHSGSLPHMAQGEMPAGLTKNEQALRFTDIHATGGAPQGQHAPRRHAIALWHSKALSLPSALSAGSPWIAMSFETPRRLASSEHRLVSVQLLTRNNPPLSRA